MSSIYLRIEAQNLANTLFDTDKLNVIRGGSFMLRDAILTVGAALETRATPVRVGAEAAVFKLESEVDSAACIRDVRQSLADEAPAFTFAVASARANNDAEGIDRTAAVVRWMQPRQVRLVMPPATSQTSEICDLTKVRPAETKNDEGMFFSRTAVCRQKFGQGAKRAAFYAREAGSTVAQGLHFTNDLERLAEHGPCRTSSGKMAVLSMDGNSFGKIAAKLEATEAQQLDAHLRKLRGQLLTRVVNFMKAPELAPRERKNGGDVRMEVLLWAGDEFQLIVPAWLGFALLQEVFDETRAWRASKSANAEPLTLSAGLLICSRKMPIYRALKLAEDLQCRAKQKVKTLPELHNAWDYLVLESLDYSATMDLDTYWQRRLPGAKAPVPLLACKDYGQNLHVLAKALDDADSRRKVYASAQLIADPQSPHAKETEKWQKTQQGLAVLDAVRALLPPLAEENRALGWLHLREIWDYILPPELARNLQLEEPRT